MTINNSLFFSTIVGAIELSIVLLVYGVGFAPVTPYIFGVSGLALKMHHSS